MTSWAETGRISESAKGCRVTRVVRSLTTRGGIPTPAAAAAMLFLSMILALVSRTLAWGGDALVTWLRDAGQTVGDGGLLGAIGAAISGGLLAIGGFEGGMVRAAGDFGAGAISQNISAGARMAADLGLGRYATLDAATPGVQARVNGVWQDAAPGMQIGPDDALMIPKGGGAVQYTTPGGDLNQAGGGGGGRGGMVPGGWLNDAQSSSMIPITRDIEAAAESLVGHSGGKSQTTTGGTYVGPPGPYE